MNDLCRTPQLDWTRQQSLVLADLLAGRLAGQGDVQIEKKLPWQLTGNPDDKLLGQQFKKTDTPTTKLTPAIAMRYWHPFPAETVAQLMENGCEQFLLVPMYPQFSHSTSGSILDFTMKSLRKLAPTAPVFTLAGWHLLPGYIAALAQPVSTQLTAWATAEQDPRHTALIFVAHSLPQKLIDRGDPYLELTIDTVSAVHHQVLTDLAGSGHHEWLSHIDGGQTPQLAFQSKIGPVKWVGPEVGAEISRLAKAGYRRVMVQPVSFTCEHVETLVELDLELRHKATAAGIEDFQRGAALNLNQDWLASLADHLHIALYVQACRTG